MRIALTSIVSGVLFGAGLALGGMTDPARVRGFLDIFGDWDPTLAFVMGGAVIVMAIAWRIVPRLAEPIFAEEFHPSSYRRGSPVRYWVGNCRTVSGPWNCCSCDRTCGGRDIRCCDACRHGCCPVF